MAYSAMDGRDGGLAAFAHLGAILGPLVPLLVWLSRRKDDAYVTKEAAKATNAGMAFFVIFVSATIVELWVPLVGFVGRLAQLAVVIVAVFLCVQSSRRVRDGLPASYPIEIRVVKTHD